MRRFRAAMRRYWVRTAFALPAATVSFLVSAAPAYADLKLCNRMSYVVEVAIGIDDKAATATRGWFRIDPAACRVVAQGTLTADRILLNARALGVYGVVAGAAERQRYAVHRAGKFRHCGGPPVPCRTDPGAVHPDQPDQDRRRPSGGVSRPKDSEYDDEQARLAAIQRLLVIAGYDAAPIDGVDGPKTQAALAAFLKNRGLAADIVQSPKLLRHHDRRGAIAIVDRADLVQRHAAQDHGRGRHRRRQDRDQPRLVSHRSRQMPASRRVRPAKQIFSFAEAVDSENRSLKFRDRPLNWGGATQLCTRETKFEINDQNDCGNRGLTVTGFAAVDMSGGGKTLRFAMP